MRFPRCSRKSPWAPGRTGHWYHCGRLHHGKRRGHHRRPAGQARPVCLRPDQAKGTGTGYGASLDPAYHLHCFSRKTKRFFAGCAGSAHSGNHPAGSRLSPIRLLCFGGKSGSNSADGAMDNRGTTAGTFETAAHAAAAADKTNMHCKNYSRKMLRIIENRTVKDSTQGFLRCFFYAKCSAAQARQQLFAAFFFPS